MKRTDLKEFFFSMIVAIATLVVVVVVGLVVVAVVVAVVAAVVAVVVAVLVDVDVVFAKTHHFCVLLSMTAAFSGIVGYCGNVFCLQRPVSFAVVNTVFSCCCWC